MKLSSTFVALGMLQAVLAQSIAPSPTESIGCEPHGDHWHCEGPRPTDDAAATDGAEGDDGDDAAVEETTSEDPGPSPTESIGCEPHGDHWHCEGPAETDGADADEGEDGDDDADASEDPGPSPTESIGCEPHGDHWHCDGPVESGAAGDDGEEDGDSDDEPAEGAAGSLQVSLGAVAAIAALALA